VIRPGPTAIEPGVCPGGIVFHVYGVPSGRLLHTSTAADLSTVDAMAKHDADMALAAMRTGETGLCLVAFDGDSGERFDPLDWVG
jgi:hypothetical protein